jgi:uracil-DNA glycosylase
VPAIVPRTSSLRKLAEAAASCTACPLHAGATQTVFGEGVKKAMMLVVGEQPGDQEDRRGQPFVGPAGRVLDEAFAEAGIERDATYLTNAVKHFKWKPAPRGKRRLHARPNADELAACRPWLEAELSLVAPRAVVALGASAGRVLLGRLVRVGSERGLPIAFGDGRTLVVTYHPSAVIRARSDRDAVFAWLVADLRLAHEHV